MIEKSFYQLVSKYKITIPKIQRDYAQGRKDKKTKQIRDIFLEKIFQSLKENKPLNLDFIYGSVDKNGNFLPLDGQQRLTTLFLVYYYLVVRSGKDINGSKFENLKKFSYDTRISSKDFVEKLVSEKNNKLFGDTKDNKEIKSIKEKIKDQTWFFNEFLQDSTINGMLEMLESIEQKCNDIENIEDILKKWCDNKCPIKFKFLDLKNLNLSDELYIKMNARGKTLSDFENFKAHFIRILENIEYKNKEKIENKIDGQWLDIFWDFSKDSKEQKAEETDRMFLVFFQATLINFCCKDLEDIDKINIKDLEDINALKFLQHLDSEKIKMIEQILNNITILVEKDKTSVLLENFKIIIGTIQGEDDDGKKGKISAYDREKFYIDMLILSNDNFSLDSFANSNSAKFRRVAQNIVKNRLINKMEDFIRVLECIDELANDLNVDNFYNSLKENFDFGTKKESEIEQLVEEEKHKAKLILQSQEWENAIYEAEKHWYLDGQIDFLLNFANDDLDLFKEYFKAFNSILAESSSNNEQQTIQFRQALLTKGIYFEIASKQYHFLYDFQKGLRSKIYTWRKSVFKKDGDKSPYLKSLLDDIKNGKTLQEVIDDYLKEKGQEKGWRYHLVKHKEMWEYKHIRTPKSDKNLDGILQLTPKISTNNGIECYTYALYCELKDKLVKQYQGNNKLVIQDESGNKLVIQYQVGNSSDTRKMGILLNEDKLLVWNFNENKSKSKFYIIDKDSTEICDQDKYIGSNTDDINEKFQEVLNYLQDKFNKENSNAKP